MSYSKAIKYGNLWFKYKKEKNGSEHILVSENEKGLEIDSFGITTNYVAHDHYILKNAEFFSQTKTNNPDIFKIDSKNHIFEHNSKFPSDFSTQKGLEIFFENVRNQVKLADLQNDIKMSTLEDSPENSNRPKTDHSNNTKMDFSKYKKDIASTLGGSGSSIPVVNTSGEDQIIAVIPSESTRGTRADIEYLKEMYWKINNYREDTKELINKLSINVMAQSQGRIWSDIRQYRFVSSYVQPIHQSLKKLINEDYDFFEEILRTHIKNLGEIIETYDTVLALDNLHFIFPEVVLPTNLNLVDNVSAEQIYTFGIELKDFIKNLVEQTNYLIEYYNSLAYNEHWDDKQHGKYGYFFMVLTKQLNEIIELIKTALDDLNLNIIPVYNNGQKYMLNITFP